jgi:hypothetical protein
MSEGIDKDREEAIYSFFERIRKESQTYMTPQDYVLGCATEYVVICQSNMIANDIILKNVKNMLKIGE